MASVAAARYPADMTALDVLAVHREADPRLSAVVNLLDFEAIARDRMAPAAYDYVAGGAGDEWSLARNLAAWREHPLRPRVLVDVSTVAAAPDAMRSWQSAAASIPGCS